MKKFKFTLLLIVLLPLFTSYQTMAREKYRIEIKTLDGVTYYYPMALRRNGKLFKEWVYLTDNIYPTREAALDIVNRAKAIETNYEISKNVQFLYIK